jgi:hypothetical protein
VTDPGSGPTGGPGPDRASYAAALRATFDGLDPVVALHRWWTRKEP